MFRQKAGVFIICLIISIILWLLVVLSKDYTVSYQFPVKYINQPASKVIASALPKQVAIQIKGSGMQQLHFQLFKPEGNLNIDLSKAHFDVNNKEFVFETRSTLDTVNKQFNHGIQVIRIQPDAIYFKVKPKLYKKLPVKLVALLNYERQFQLNGIIKLSPSEIMVSGDSSELASLSEIQTENTMLKNIRNNINQKVNLVTPPGYNTIELITKQTDLFIPVDKYTEASVEVPVHIDNTPRGRKIKTIPEKVKVTYTVALSRFEKINSNMFLVKGDFKKSEADNSNKIKLELIKTPQYVRNAKIFPEKVEYILKQN